MIDYNMTADVTYYNTVEWIILFFIYSFLGWVWESIYMSILERKPLNRGFLYGPWIPIYGFGATTMLFATMPFRDRVWLVALIGMLVGNSLEEIAGRVMEKIFDVRYWSYEGYPGNIDGFICIPATLLWGFFSVLSLYQLNRPFDYLIRTVDRHILVNVCMMGVILFTVDVVLSVRNALDFKEMMSKIANAREKLARLRRRLDVMIAIWQKKHPRAAKLRNNFSSQKDNMMDLFDSVKDRIELLEELRSSENGEDTDFLELLEIKEEYKEQDFLRKHYFPRFTKHVKRLLYSNPKAKLKKVGFSLKEIAGLIFNHFPSNNDDSDS